MRILTLAILCAAAVLQGEGSNTVYREISTGTFEPVTVTLGNRVGDKMPVTSGLHAGDRVITEGISKVRDGMTVNPKPPAEPRP